MSHRRCSGGVYPRQPTASMSHHMRSVGVYPAYSTDGAYPRLTTALSIKSPPIRPNFRSGPQIIDRFVCYACPNRVFPYIAGNIGYGFLFSQSMVKKAALPQGTSRINGTCNRSQFSLKQPHKTNDFISLDQKMDMIGHYAPSIIFYPICTRYILHQGDR